MTRDNRIFVISIILSIVLQFFVVSLSESSVLFREGFEDSSFPSRGWYDTTGGVIDKNVYKMGNGSYSCTFAAGSTRCSGGDPRRIKFTSTESVYISFWIRFSSNWTSSNRGYHPHIIYLMTNLSGDYDGMYGSYTTAYIEENENRWRMGMQDGMNINVNYLQTNLCNTTENRASHGCNGICDSNAWDVRDCYDLGGGDWVNGRWATGGSIMNETWYFVEAYFKMNSISSGKGQKDGKFKLIVNGTTIFNYTDIIYRTSQHVDMKWEKLIISPYIGDGSPIAQQLWIDDLTIATDFPVGSTLSPPTGLRVIAP